MFPVYKFIACLEISGHRVIDGAFSCVSTHIETLEIPIKLGGKLFIYLKTACSVKKDESHRASLLKIPHGVHNRPYLVKLGNRKISNK